MTQEEFDKLESGTLLFYFDASMRGNEFGLAFFERKQEQFGHVFNISKREHILLTPEFLEKRCFLTANECIMHVADYINWSLQEQWKLFIESYMKIYGYIHKISEAIEDKPRIIV